MNSGIKHQSFTIKSSEGIRVMLQVCDSRAQNVDAQDREETSLMARYIRVIVMTTLTYVVSVFISLY